MRLKEQIVRMAKEAKTASQELATVPTRKKNRALLRMADALERERPRLFRENAKDIARARQRHLSGALVDRLVLTEKRIRDMAASLRQIARLPDPVGELLEESRLKNGLRLRKV